MAVAQGSGYHGGTRIEKNFRNYNILFKYLMYVDKFLALKYLYYYHKRGKRLTMISCETLQWRRIVVIMGEREFKNSITNDVSTVPT